MIAVTLIMLYLMTEQNAGITNNDAGYGTQIAKLGKQMMTLQNDKMKVGFCRKQCTSTLYKQGYVNMR